MLSILIPVYNYDVRRLVKDLVHQLDDVEAVIDLHLLDDGSTGKWGHQYEELSQIPVVNVHRSKENIGRVGARRKLAEASDHKYLLFIDCDAEVISNGFISTYLDYIESSDVVVGGHIYETNRPDGKFSLHWKYGKDKEVRTLATRIGNPYQSFSTFNFCVSRKIFKEYLHDIDLAGYGHEDTLIGYLLKKNGVAISHIHNPLIHAGLKENNQFIQDTNSSLRNALLLSKKYPDIDLKIIRYVDRLRRLGLVQVFVGLMNLLEQKVVKNLNSDKPSILCLQLYKLKYILELDARG